MRTPLSGIRPQNGALWLLRALERVAAVPSLTVRVAGVLGGGAPACLVVEVVERPSAAAAEFSVNENIPCSLPDPVFLRGAKDALLRALHGGHTGPPRREKRALDSRHAGFL